MFVPVISPLIHDGLAAHAVLFLRWAERVIPTEYDVRVIFLHATGLRRVTENGHTYRTVGGFSFTHDRSTTPHIDVACPWKSCTARTMKLVELRTAHELWHLTQYLAGDDPHETNWRAEERAMRAAILDAADTTPLRKKRSR